MQVGKLQLIRGKVAMLHKESALSYDGRLAVLPRREGGVQGFIPDTDLFTPKFPSVESLITAVNDGSKSVVVL